MPEFTLRPFLALNLAALALGDVLHSPFEVDNAGHVHREPHEHFH